MTQPRRLEGEHWDVAECSGADEEREDVQYNITVNQLWQHIEVLTSMAYQSLMGMQHAQWGVENAHGGTRCHCGCIVYPRIQQVRSPEKSATTGEKRGSVQEHEWRPWRRVFKPRLDSRKRAVVSDRRVVCSATDCDGDEADSDGVDNFERVVTSEVKQSGAVGAASRHRNKLPNKQCLVQENDDDLLERAIAEVKAAGHGHAEHETAGAKQSTEIFTGFTRMFSKASTPESTPQISAQQAAASNEPVVRVPKVVSTSVFHGLDPGEIKAAVEHAKATRQWFVVNDADEVEYQLEAVRAWNRWIVAARGSGQGT